MPEFSCFITCHGERKGPFTLTQLKQMRAEDMLPEDAFTPEEWAAVRELLNSQEVRETSFWKKKESLVHVKQISFDTYSGMQKLLICLTWIGYAVGLSLIGWGILRADEGPISRLPSLWIAIFFAICLARTTVTRLIRRQLKDPEAKASQSKLLLSYLLGQLPLLMAIISAFAVNYFLIQEPFSAPLARAAGLCFLAGAVFTSRLPSSLYRLWRQISLKPLRPYSNGWAMLSMLTFTFVVLAYYADTFPQTKAAMTYVRLIFNLEPEVAIREWAFPVGLGTSRRRVEKVFGEPDRSGDGQFWFNDAGLGVSYTSFGRVAKLSFVNQGKTKDELPPIVWDLNVASSYDELCAQLAAPLAVFANTNFQICKWTKPPLDFSAVVWTRDTNQNGKFFPKGSLKLLEITRAPKHSEPHRH